MTGFQSLFEKSLNEKKGITVFFEGQNISGIVTTIGAQAIELKNQTHAPIVILIDRISGVAMN